MKGITDIHQHILWGLDDGPSQPEEMQAMLREAADQGILRIAATPHAHPGFRAFDMRLYQERLTEAQKYCNENRLGIRMMQGAEIAWTYQTVEMLRRGQLPTLNGTDCVLIEFWREVTWREIRTASAGLLRAGFMPVLSHVDRYRCFLWQPEKALELKRELAVDYQVNASTIIRPYGYLQRRFIRYMLERRGIDAVASDAHNCTSRSAQMAQALRVLQVQCPDDYARALVDYGKIQKGGRVGE